MTGTLAASLSQIKQSSLGALRDALAFGGPSIGMPSALGSQIQRPEAAVNLQAAGARAGKLHFSVQQVST